MPRYRIHRMKETPRENFRWAPHIGGRTIVKPKDYDCSREIDAATPYAVWKLLGQQGDALRPGDLLEIACPDGTTGEMQITKYIGFEPAEWHVPELRGEASTSVTEFAPGPLNDLSLEHQS